MSKYWSDKKKRANKDDVIEIVPSLKNEDGNCKGRQNNYIISKLGIELTDDTSRSWYYGKKTAYMCTAIAVDILEGSIDQAKKSCNKAFVISDKKQVQKVLNLIIRLGNNANENLHNN